MIRELMLSMHVFEEMYWLIVRIDNFDRNSPENCLILLVKLGGTILKLLYYGND